MSEQDTIGAVLGGASMKPYYQQSGITIYHADCRAVLPQLGPVDVVITDPVWPNSLPSLVGADAPYELFADAARYFPRITNRLVVQLGCDSDPRFLAGVPPELPFFRTCQLEYAHPFYKGRVLYMADVAYAFGQPPPSEPGRHLIPGKCMSPIAGHRSKIHPCVRDFYHVRWLVRWFARGLVVDPFMGVGTTLRAAKELGYPAIGIEICEEFCEEAANSLQQETFMAEVAV